MMPNFKKNFSSASVANPSFTQQKKPKKSGGKKIDINFLVSTVIFFITAVALVLSFGANYYLEQRIENFNLLIQQQRDEFQLDAINTLTAFDKQVDSIQKLFSSRGAYEILLVAASQSVEPNTSYKDLNINRDGDTFTISIGGVSNSFSSYLQQVRGFVGGSNPVSGGNVDTFRVVNDSSGRNNNAVEFKYMKTVSLADVLSYQRN